MENKKRLSWICGICSLILTLEAAFGGIFPVTNTQNSGPGSLRQAILDAQAVPGPNIVAFQIPMSDPGYDAISGTWTIQPLSSLPIITSGSITVDGLSQSNFSGDDTNPLGPEIVIDGSQAGSNTIGFDLRSSGNVIEGLVIGGFTDWAIKVSTEEVRNNQIWGNYIGIDASGSLAFGNFAGICLHEGTRANVIGGTSPENRNVISGNENGDISIQASDSNRVIGNYIGTDASGTSGFFPNSHGIHISGGCYNEIGGLGRGEGNLISGHGWDGIQIVYEESQYNLIRGNLIGTDASGLYAIHNGTGIGVSGSNNTIGPANTIRFNGNAGVAIYGITAHYNRITQNSIYDNGTGINIYNGGNDDMPKPVITDIGSVVGTAEPFSTVEIFSDSLYEGRVYEGTVTADASGNFVWPGTPEGPFVTATATDVDGNTSMFSDRFRLRGWIVINTNDDYEEGSLRWAIWESNENPGPDTISFRIPMTDPGFDGLVWRIRPGYEFGYELPDLTDGNLFIDGLSQTRDIGDTNPDGPEIMIEGPGLASGEIGFYVQSPGNIIRGLIVSGFGYTGFLLWGEQARGNTITGNYIGTDPEGIGSLGNDFGICVQDNADLNRIGGPNPGEGNLISGNIGTGIYVFRSDSVLIQGNMIGLDRSGTAALGNGGDGIYTEECSSIHIGGGESGEENTISGNGDVGIYVYTSRGIEILGNRIGTDITGTSGVPNACYGIRLYHSPANTVGGVSPDSGNVISGNGGSAIFISGVESDSNRVVGNFIGTDTSGTIPLPNGSGGIEIFYAANHNTIGPDNLIRYNGYSGVIVGESESVGNRITQNSICGNESAGIALINGGNGSIEQPEVSSAGPVEGTAPPYSIVEVFSDSFDQGRIYEASVEADENGHFSWAGTPQGPNVTVTATDTSGNTSIFSMPGVVAVENRDVSLVPETFFLSQNYPNPFNPTTTIQFGVDQASHVRLTIVDLSGREVSVLADGMYSAGSYEIVFDAKDLSSGVYFYRIQTDRMKLERKLVLVK